MGLLDSNKLNIQQKSGNFTCDLASSSGQNEIAFNGVGYTRLALQIEGVPSGADIIIVAKGGIVSTYNPLQCYDASGNPVNITGNGRYYVDVTGLTGIYFQVTRMIESGSCTVNWSLSNSDDVYKKDEQLETIIGNMQKQKILNDGKKTYSVSEVANLETFNNVDKCGCFVVNVETIASDAAITLIDNKNRSCVGYDSDGNIIIGSMSSAGKYYFNVDITVPTVVLRCSAAVDSGSTAEIRTGWMKDIPSGVAELKPIQLIKNFSSGITSTSAITLISQNDTKIKAFIKRFKYFFYSYMITNNDSSVARTCHISVQPYHNYNGTYKAGKEKELSVVNGYSYQSEWFEINGDALRMYVQNESVSEGDTITLNLYGVR